MKRIILSITAAVAALALPSCLQSHTTINLNKDGSGTIVEETTFGAQLAAMLDMGAAAGNAEGQKNPLGDILSEDKAKERATAMGEGVTLDKVEKLTADGKKGARVTYKFADINKVKFSMTSGALKEMGGDEEKAKDPEKPVTFKYADGTLTLVNPDKPKDDKEAAKGDDAKDDAAADPNAAQAEAMMKAMMADMKVSLKLNFPGGIAETNATHVDGNTVTLADMDMGKLMENADALKKLQKGGKNPMENLEQLKDAPGVKVETKKEITVKLK